jgi:hypothetical protein
MPGGGGGGFPTTFLNIPDDVQFSKLVSACECFNLQSGCPIDLLVDVHDAVAYAKDIVMAELPKLTDEAGCYRVPPLVLSRIARGGKTTALCLLFDALKIIEVDGVKVNVMIISFNGSTSFNNLSGETQTNAIIRNIVRQLIEPNDDHQRVIRCTPQVLDEYIGTSPFVLLIDELNALSDVLDEEAGSFLRRLFLDKKNRYLVFTTHVPMNLDPNKSSNAALFMAGSGRGVKSLYLPVSTNLQSLRLMPGCESINAATVALYGGIPSLIYSVFALNEIGPFTRFKAAKLEEILIDVDMTSLLSQFVQAVIQGERNSHLRIFDQFAITTADRIQWPICYIKCILGLFEQTVVTRYILNQCIHLETQASMTGGGLDWECIIKIALGFRCLNQQFHGYGSPFDIVQDGEKTNVFVMELPDNIVSVSAAKKYILQSAQTTPALVLATPTYSSFPVVDGLVAYVAPKPKISLLYGYQAKLGQGLPAQNLRNKKQGLDKGILLQGRARDSALLTLGWDCLDKVQAQALVGYSLKDLYPGNWPNALAADDTQGN